MIKYVAGFMLDGSNNTVLVRKTKPAWQAGRLNGVGGKIEDGETPLSAMVREWCEETGDDHVQWKEFARIVSTRSEVFFFKAVVDVLPAFPPLNDGGEPLEIHAFDSIAGRDDTIQHVKWLLPLAFKDPNDFVVEARVVA